MEREVVVYDADCPFCRSQVARIRRLDRRGAFEFVPRQSPELAERFPTLATPGFDSGLRLVSLEGDVVVGADALYRIARRLPLSRRLAWVYRLPPIRALARQAYARVAARRSGLARGCADESCEIPRG